jgi:hypothetical protein
MHANSSGMTPVDWFKAFITIAGFIAALPGLVSTLKKLRHRLSQWLRIRRSGAAHKVAILRPSKASYSAFLFREEIIVILSAAVLMNFVSLCLSTRLQSILYLDMTGTATAALLLGPWYGAMAGLLSSGFVNWIASSMPNGDVNIVPWAMVNMCGGVLWGYFGRSEYFARFMEQRGRSIPSQIKQVLKFGFVGAVVMAVPGAAVQWALGSVGVLSLDQQLSTAFDKLLLGSIPNLKSFFAQFFNEGAAATLATYVVYWVQNAVKYVPDKTLSFMIAVVVIKAGFPLFEQQLIHLRGNTLLSKPKALDGVAFLAILVPYTVVLLVTPHFGSHKFWPLWLAPFVICAVILMFESLLRRRSRPQEPSAQRQKDERRICYKRARELLPVDTVTTPGPMLLLASSATSLVFILILTLILDDNHFQVAFKFLCLVYGFLLALYLYGVATSQNLALGLAHEEPPKQQIVNVG